MAEEKKTFRKGDQVTFVPGGRSCSPTPDPDRVYTIKDVHPSCDGVYLEELASHLWYRADHFKLVEPGPQRVHGVPDGYRLVRIGAPEKGETYLDGSHTVAMCFGQVMTKGWAIVEKTTKTERLWVWVDKETGEATDQWFADGAVPTIGTRISEVRTNKTREVPA